MGNIRGNAPGVTGQGSGTAVARWSYKGGLVAMVVLGGLIGVGTDQAQGADLRPGVRPGEIVVIREVEPAPFGQVNRDSGPIRARADLMQSSRMAQATTAQLGNQTSGITAVMLNDTQAAGISSGVGGSMAQLHRSLGTGSSLGAGGNVQSNRVAGSIGGGAAGGGVIGATSGIASTITGALAPLTGGRR